MRAPALQIAQLTNRTLLWPDIPCETAWLHTGGQDDPDPRGAIDTRGGRGALDHDVDDAQCAGDTGHGDASCDLVVEPALAPLMPSEGTLLLRQSALVLDLQGAGLRARPLGSGLAPGIDDVHAAGDACLHDSGELVAVAGHAPTVRRPRPAWHPRPMRT